MSDLMSSPAYDVVGLVGEADEFTRRSGSRFNHDDGAIVLSFAPRARFGDARRYLDISDAVVLCDVIEGDWLEVTQVAYHFFESLILPSLLNIDLADVKRIAKGIGLAFNLSGDDHEKMIEALPKDCFVARSAILHFLCRDDVRLGEIHSISKSIALKKGLSDELSSDSEVIRKVNVKMGVRILEDYGQKRISMTAILFGI